MKPTKRIRKRNKAWKHYKRIYKRISESWVQQLKNRYYLLPTCKNNETILEIELPDTLIEKVRGKQTW